MRPIDVVDQRVRMALRGTETIRAVVDSVHGQVATVRTGGSLLPALVAGNSVVPGSVVECYRPRGVGGQLHIRAVLS